MSSWNAVPLWSLVSINDDVLPESTASSFEFEYVDISAVTPGSISNNLEVLTFGKAPSRARRLARPGDVVMSTVRTYLRAVAPVVATERPRVYSTGFAVMRPRVGLVESKFLAYRLVANDFLDQVEAQAVGVSYPAITANELSHVRLTVPSMAEQARVADYLNREVAAIDTLIDKQRELVAGLRQRRTAVIVGWTTGECVEGNRRSSSASWLKELPARWREEPLKRVFPDLQTGFWGGDEAGDESDIRVVRVADFDRPTLSVGTAPTIRSVSASERARASLCRGDLLMEKSGGTGKNPVGFVVAYESDEESIYANFIVRLRPRPEQDERFWLYALNGSYTSGLTWKSVNQTTGIQNLDMTSFMSEVFPVPPLDEQRAIADHLDAETAKIDALIAKAERFIELAQERRAALITAAVTGQIEIPEAGAAA